MTMQNSGTVNPEWYNGNELRAYPLDDGCHASSVIPSWLIADMTVTIPDSFGSPFISSVYISPALVSVGVSATVRGDIRGILAATAVLDELRPGRIVDMDAFDRRAAGAIVFGGLGVSVSGVQKYEFSQSEAPLCPHAVTRVTHTGIPSIVDIDHGELITGIVDLSNNGAFTTYADPEDRQTIVVRLNDDVRDECTSICRAAPDIETCGMTPIRTINGVSPDADGKITLRFK